MKRHVVDTNVPIVANGLPDPSRGSREVSVKCRLAAIDFLQELLRTGRTLLDSAGEIQKEYDRHLDPKRQPGVGDLFYLELLRGASNRVERVHLARLTDGSFADFPTDPKLAGFDASDRKFAALARHTGAPVFVATDSDWLDFQAPLNANAIGVHFICGECREGWFNT